MSNIFSPKTPTPTPVSRQPDAADPAILEAQRKRAAEMMARGGRRSTILSSGTDTAVGGTYQGRALG